MSSIVFREYYPHTGSAPFICPSISTWRKSAILETPEENFLPGRNSCCTFSQTPLTPTWEKSGKLTSPPEIFSARESSSNVQNRAFWKPLPEIFLKYFLMSINIHRSPRETCQRHLLSAAPYCPLPLYVKIEAKWKHFMEISYQADFWREPRCCKGVIIGDHPLCCSLHP